MPPHRWRAGPPGPAASSRSSVSTSRRCDEWPPLAPLSARAPPPPSSTADYRTLTPVDGRVDLAPDRGPPGPRLRVGRGGHRRPGVRRRRPVAVARRPRGQGARTASTRSSPTPESRPRSPPRPSPSPPNSSAPTGPAATSSPSPRPARPERRRLRRRLRIAHHRERPALAHPVGQPQRPQPDRRARTPSSRPADWDERYGGYNVEYFIGNHTAEPGLAHRHLCHRPALPSGPGRHHHRRRHLRRPGRHRRLPPAHRSDRASPSSGSPSTRATPSGSCCRTSTSSSTATTHCARSCSATRREPPSTP